MPFLRMRSKETAKPENKWIENKSTFCEFGIAYLSSLA